MIAPSFDSVHLALKNLLVIAFVFIINIPSYSQTDFVVIDSVIVIGLHKTKKIVVSQEIDLHSGDTISIDQLASRLHINEKRIQSTGIFTLASINVKDWNTDLNTCDIYITVQENWYLYPHPIFELADRNFNVWRKEFNYSLSRVNYGLAITHTNFSGSKDKAKLKIQGGYVRKLELLYDLPYLHNKWGASANILYSENREIAYNSIDNKPVFYHTDDKKKVYFVARSSIAVQRRSNAQFFQTMKLEYNYAKIDTMISRELNPSYFGLGREKVHYFFLDYLAKYDNTIYPLYPIGGFKIELNLRKEGLGIFNDVDNLWMTFHVEKHHPFFKNFIMSNKVRAKIQFLNNDLPYFLNNALGYSSNNITGYQLYVMDGRSYILSKNSLKYKVLDKNIKIFKFVPKHFKVMSTQLFVRGAFDIGYSDNPLFKAENKLSNTWQYGYGPGLDLILFNTLTVSAEYGITKFGEKGFFFSSGFNF
jgi:hypothetical protein